MFVITAEPQFTHTIKIMVPVDGGHEEQTVKARFRVVDEKCLSDGQGVEGQKADLRKLLVSLDDLVDDQKQPVPYSDALRDQLLAVSYIRVALLNGYISAVTKAPAGN